MPTPAAQARLRLTDTTLRDGNQSLFGGALTNDELVELAARFDGLGFAALEVFGGATYEAALTRGEDPWDGLARMAAATAKTPLQALIRGQHLVGERGLPDDAVRLWIQTAADLGVDVFRVFDALNDLRNLEVPVAAARAVQKRVQGALAYTVSPVHDLELWRELALGMKDLGVDDIVIKDTGGLLTPQVVRGMVPALALATGLPILVHSHSSAGLAPFTYLAAIEAGAAGVDTAFAAFGDGAGQPGVEALVAVLQGTRDTGLDLARLVGLRDELEEIRSRHRDDLLPFADRADPQLLQYALPHAMLQDIVALLDDHRARARFDEVLDEVARVRKDLGWPPLLAPVRQLVADQAVYNVLSSTRYETVTQELKDYLQGLYGEPPKPVATAVRTQVLGQSDPITVRPADLLEPAVESTRDTLLKEAQAADDTEATGCAALPPTDGDVVHAILFPELAAQLRGSRRALAELAAREEEVREEELAAAEAAGGEAAPDGPATTADAAPAPQTAELQVEVEGEVFTVRVTGAGFAITPGAAAASSAPASADRAPEAPRAASPQNAVVAPMQGLIVKIPVEVGTEVQLGDVVAVLEAMKMQNDIVATRAGTVTQVLVKEQDVVTPDQPLVAIG